jgi:hypothetical protein
VDILFFLDFIFLGLGLIIYLVNFLIFRFIKDRKVFWWTQYTLAILYLLFYFWVYIGKPTQIDPLRPNETDPLSPFQIDPLIPAEIDPLNQVIKEQLFL